MTSREYLNRKLAEVENEIEQSKSTSGKESALFLGSAFSIALGMGFLFSPLWPFTVSFASIGAYIYNKKFEEKIARKKKIERLGKEKKHIEKLLSNELTLNASPERINSRARKIAQLKSKKQSEEKKIKERKLTSSFFFGGALLATVLSTVLPAATVALVPISLLGNIIINNSKKRNGLSAEEQIEKYKMDINTLEMNSKVIELENAANRRARQSRTAQRPPTASQQTRTAQRTAVPSQQSRTTQRPPVPSQQTRTTQRPPMPRQPQSANNTNNNNRQASPSIQSTSQYENAINKYVENLGKQTQTSKVSQKIKK